MALIQVSSPVVKSSDSGSTPQEFIFPSPLTAGSSVLLLVVNYTNTTPTSAVISDGSQALNLDGAHPTSLNKAYIYSLKNITSTGASNPKVTLTPGGSTDNYITGVAIEISEKITWEDNTTVDDGTGNRTINNTPVGSDNFAVSLLAVNSDTSNANMTIGSGCTQIFVNQNTVGESGAIGAYSYNPSSSTVTHVINVPSVNTQGLMAMYAIDEDGPTEYTITPSGGVVFSGAPTFGRDRILEPSGGVGLSGNVEPTLSHEWIVSPSGGIVFSGTVEPIREQAISPAGGVSFSGEVQTVYEKILEPAGGIIFDGTGGAFFEPNGATEYLIEPSGGVVFSGSADVLRERLVAPSGGITFSGAVSLQREMFIVPSGGVSFDGNPTFGGDHIIVPNGGIVFGGNGGIFFVPEGGTGGSGLWDSRSLNLKISKMVGL